MLVRPAGHRASLHGASPLVDPRPEARDHGRGCPAWGQNPFIAAGSAVSSGFTFTFSPPLNQSCRSVQCIDHSDDGHAGFLKQKWPIMFHCTMVIMCLWYSTVVASHGEFGDFGAGMDSQELIDTVCGLSSHPLPWHYYRSWLIFSQELHTAILAYFFFSSFFRESILLPISTKVTCVSSRRLARSFQVSHHAKASDEGRPRGNGAVGGSPCVPSGVLEIRGAGSSLPAAHAGVIQVQP